MDSLAGEVDVTPAQRQQLTLAKPGVGGGQVKGSMLFVVSMTRERRYFGSVEGHEFAGVADGGPIDQFGAGRIARQVVRTDSMLEHAVGDGEVTYHGAWRQPGGHEVLRLQITDTSVRTDRHVSAGQFGLPKQREVENVTGAEGEALLPGRAPTQSGGPPGGATSSGAAPATGKVKAPQPIPKIND